MRLSEKEMMNKRNYWWRFLESIRVRNTTSGLGIGMDRLMMWQTTPLFRSFIIPSNATWEKQVKIELEEDEKLIVVLLQNNNNKWSLALKWPLDWVVKGQSHENLDWKE
jgi:hypothetical protein